MRASLVRRMVFFYVHLIDVDSVTDAKDKYTFDEILHMVWDKIQKGLRELVP